MASLATRAGRRAGRPAGGGAGGRGQGAGESGRPAIFRISIADGRGRALDLNFKTLNRRPRLSIR